jgi:hypothetical protein
VNVIESFSKHELGFSLGVWSGMVLSVMYAHVQGNSQKEKLCQTRSVSFVSVMSKRFTSFHFTSSRLASLLCPIVPQPTARLVYSPLLLRNLRLALSLAISSARDILHFHVAVFILHPLRVCRAGAIHHSQTTGSQLVDSPYGVDGFVQSSSSVEVFLDRGQEVLVATIRLGTSYPWV